MKKEFKHTHILSIILFFISHLVISQISYQPYVALPTSSWPEVVCIDDVNNDGLNDVVLGLGNYFDPINDYKVFVYTQNSTGGLNSPVIYPYPTSYPEISALTIGDVNNDNLKDVIIGYGNSIGIYFQNTSGFLNAIQTYTSGTGVDGVKTGDLNNDGLRDIVVSHWNANYIRVFYQSASSFTTATFTKPAGGNDEIDIGDINNDGKNDVIFMAGQLAGGIHVYTQNSSGSLNTYISYYPPPASSYNSIHGIALGDLNNDNRKDLVVSRGGNTPNANIVLWFQDTISNLLQTPAISIQAYDIPEPIEIADLNCDGKNEIITAHGGWNKLSIYEQDGIGNYGTYTMFPIPYATQYKPGGLSIGDINNDGRKDIAIADYNNGLVLLYNISTIPTKTISTINDISNVTCFGLSNGNATVTPTSGGPFDYLWSPSNYTTSVVNGLSAGTYTINMKDGTCLSYSTTLSINEPPALISTLSVSNYTICKSASVDLIANYSGGSPPYSINWNTGASASNSISPTLTNTSVYTYTLTDNNNCSITSSVQINVDSVKSDFNFSSSNCNGLTSFTSTSQYANSVTWDFGDGTNNNSSMIITHNYLASGVYTVALVASSIIGCKDTIEQVIVITPEFISADFDYILKKADCSDSVLFINKTLGVTDFIWTFGDGNISSELSPAHFYSLGNYNVTLIASNALCTVSVSKNINIMKFDSISGIRPNVFSPNGDYVNDIFDFRRIVPCGEFLFKIYNRWGLLILESNRIQSFWDGRTTDDKPVPEGTYFYVIDMENGHKLEGTVTVFR